MTVLLNNSFEGGINGTALTTGSGGNTGGSSGAYFDTGSHLSDITFSNDHTDRSPLSAKFVTPTPGEVAWVGWSSQIGTAVNKLWFRIYAYFTANPSGPLVLAQFLDSSGTQCARLVLGTTGLLQFKDNSSHQIATAVPVTLNQWIRIEGYVLGQSIGGQLEFKLFNSSGSSTPSDTQTSTATFNTTNNVGQVKFGSVVLAVDGITFYLDDLGVSDVGYMGLSKISGSGGVKLKKMKLAGSNVSFSPGIFLSNTFEGGTDGTALTQGSGGNTGGQIGAPDVIGHTTSPNGYNDEIQAITGTSPGFKKFNAARYCDGDLTVTGAPVISNVHGSPAQTCQKWFMPNGHYYLTQSALPVDLTNLIDGGAKILFCAHPGSSTTAGQAFVLTDAHRQNWAKTIYAVMAYAQNAGAPDPWFILGQEANGGGDAFADGQQGADDFSSWYNYYAPVVENPTAYVSTIPAGSGSKVGYCPVMTAQTNGNYQQWYPGDQHVHFVTPDFYGMAYRAGLRIDQPYGAATVSIMDLADNNTVHGPVPFGLAEWGVSGTYYSNPLSQAEYKTWYQHVGNTLAQRKLDGKVNAPTNFFSGFHIPENNLLPGTQANYGIGYNLITGMNYVHDKLAVGTSGPGSGDYFDTIHIASGGTIQFSSAHPSRTPMAAKITTDATGELVYAEWNNQLGGAANKLWFRIYAFLPALPAANLVLARFMSPSGVQCARLQITTTGLIQFLGKAGAGTQINGAVAVPIPRWFRIEGYVTGSPTAGQIEFKLFKNADSNTPDEIQTSTATANTNDVVGSVQFGITTTAVANCTLFLDDLAISDADYIGAANPTEVSGSGSVSLHKPRLSAAGEAAFLNSGGVRLKKARLSGQGTIGISGTGHISLSKMTLQGVTLTPVRVRLNGKWVDAVVKARIGGTWVPATPKVRIAGAWVAIT